ncbi:MAG: sensor histidine kinase [Treponema sp.]
MNSSQKKQKLSIQLSAGFACIVFITVFAISVTSNVLIHHQFEKYVAKQQKAFSQELAEALSAQYDSAAGIWKVDYIHGFGMYALNDGYIIKVYDKNQNAVWDAENHDMTLCHKVMQDITTRMEEKHPELNGKFLTYRYPLAQNGQTVGFADISYYSPCSLNENDFKFLYALNMILLIIGITSVIGAAAAGIILARHLSVPIEKATEITREISQGNYAIRCKSDVKTAELSELNEAVNQMAQNLEKQESLRKRLTSDVAHELRTPVANVSSQLEAVLEGVWEPTPQRLKNCYEELERISELITDLENLRQIEDENMILKRQNVDLLEISMSVKQAFEQEMAEKNLTCIVSGKNVTVEGDKKRLHQAVFNLVSNAVKYSQEGGCIKICVSKEQDKSVLSVEDQGIGIAKKDLPLIFERFYRTDHSRNRKTGGAGIGLTIVKAIVQAHKGKITAESTEGKGSRFVITLWN